MSDLQFLFAADLQRQSGLQCKQIVNMMKACQRQTCLRSANGKAQRARRVRACVLRGWLAERATRCPTREAHERWPYQCIHTQTSGYVACKPLSDEQCVRAGCEITSNGWRIDIPSKLRMSALTEIDTRESTLQPCADNLASTL
jgi:hypothetical protein